jgi:hypothetical protein
VLCKSGEDKRQHDPHVDAILRESCSHSRLSYKSWRINRELGSTNGQALLARRLNCARPMQRHARSSPQEITPASVSDAERPARSMWNSRNSMHVIAACAVIVMLQFAAPLLLPIVLSVMLFYMLDPIVDWLEAWHLPRLLATLSSSLP